MKCRHERRVKYVNKTKVWYCIFIYANEATEYEYCLDCNRRLQ